MAHAIGSVALVPIQDCSTFRARSDSLINRVFPGVAIKSILPQLCFSSVDLSSAFDHRELVRAGATLDGMETDVATTVVDIPEASDQGEVSSVQKTNGFGRQVNEEHVLVGEKAFPTVLEVDTVTEAELKENGFRSTRRTKLVCTIGPACCTYEQLEAMAMGGMNVARLNMCHGTKEWHAGVVRSVRKLNAEKGYSVAVMMDTQGSEIHMDDLGGTTSVKTEVLSNIS